MAEYIEREALQKRLGQFWYGDPAAEIFFENLINGTPAANVAPVVTGEWEEHDSYICNSDGEPVAKIGVEYQCSNCGQWVRAKKNYCPMCGRRLEEV